MIVSDHHLTPHTLKTAARQVVQAAEGKILSLHEGWNHSGRSPTITRHGRYVEQPWSDWTRGFQFGMALLAYDITQEKRFLEIGIEGIRHHMPRHLTHVGVHDHGFTVMSSIGTLWRLMREGRVAADEWQRDYVELSLKVSGAVQAHRWTPLESGLGYVYSAFGPHCLFSDTMRTMRSLAVAHQLGHRFLGENDEPICLMRRLLQHCETTARFAVYRGEGRDIYDEPGRVAHQTLFNTNNGRFHCPNTQQGFSPYSTWTRAQSWVLLGFAELAEFLLDTAPCAAALPGVPGYTDARAIAGRFLETACLIAEHVAAHACTDGLAYWDTAAPGLRRMGDYASRPADPFNPHEPVDSPTAAINAQGFLRLANALEKVGDPENARRYRQAGLTMTRTLFADPYLSRDPAHQGLLLHSVYNRPHGWDTTADGQLVPNGESSMWGDFHYLELALLILRLAQGGDYPTFYHPGNTPVQSADGTPVHETQASS